MIRALAREPDTASITGRTAPLRRCLEGPDLREAIQAFKEKRPRSSAQRIPRPHPRDRADQAFRSSGRRPKLLLTSAELESRAELIIRQLKEAYALGKIPTKDFPANLAFFHLALFAYNCLNWFKRFCAPPGFERATLQRLRQQLFVIPALLVRPRGQPTLRLAASYPNQAAFRATLKRIHAFKPPWRK